MINGLNDLFRLIIKTLGIDWNLFIDNIFYLVNIFKKTHITKYIILFQII